MCLYHVWIFLQDDYKAMRQTSLERPESRMLYLENSDDNEEEYSSVFNAAPRLDYSPDSTMSRLDSTGSVDGFVPNLAPPMGGSQDSLIRPGEHMSAGSDHEDERSKRARSATQLDHPHSPHIRNIPVRRSRSGESGVCTDADTQHLTVGGYGDDRRHRLSAPTTPELSRTPEESPYYSHRSVASRPRSACIRTDSQSSGEAGPFIVTSSAHKPYLQPQRTADIPIIMDESMRSKLNQRRRTGTEKRYHTADAIRDIDKHKDATIHKRLSWNFPVNINYDDDRHNVLKGKTFSSDSLRSVPSSSGVSSTGSLHLSPDSELAESYEAESDPISVTGGPKSYFYQVAPPEEASVSEVTTAPDTLAAATADTNVEDGVSLAQSNKFSKSLPDISQLNVTSRCKVNEAIGPVLEIPREVTKSKHMTHAQILRLKKMMLLNSTLEAS